MRIMLSGRTALVTGSTSGIGLGIATSLAHAGANVMLNGFGDPDEIERSRSALATASGKQIEFAAADVSNAQQVADLVATTAATFGSIDILVNNAGIQHVAPVDEFPIDRWDAIIAINLSSSFHTIRAALPHMKQRNWGRIVNIASAHGLVASANKAAYVAAKHGVIGLTKVVALETATTGITCNAICPGWVLTPLVEKQIETIAATQNVSREEAELQILSEKQPSLQFVTPEQIGAYVVFLCSEAANEIRGAALPIDGGWTAR